MSGYHTQSDSLSSDRETMSWQKEDDVIYIETPGYKRSMSPETSPKLFPIFKKAKPEPKPKQESKMTPSLWQAQNGLYRDAVLKDGEKHVSIVYDYPRVRTDRNHLVAKDALFFVKVKAGWKIAGIVYQVVSTGTHPGTDQRYAELILTRMDNDRVFQNKNVAIQELGFKPIDENERMHGLIPLYKK
jgi:hypothetical protein